MSGPCNSSSAGRPSGPSMPSIERVLGLLGLLGIEPLALLGKEVVDELPGGVLVVRAVDDPDACGVDQRAGVARLQEMVRSRGVGLLLLEQPEVVVVDEADLDLTCSDRLDDLRVLLVELGLVRLDLLQPGRGPRPRLQTVAVR